MKTPRRAIVLLILTLLGAAPGDENQDAGETEGGLTLAERYFARAKRHVDAGETEAAREALERVLERDAQHLPTLATLGALAAQAGDVDLACYHDRRYLEILGRRVRLTGDRKEERAAVLERAEALDPLAAAWEKAAAGSVAPFESMARTYSRRQLPVSTLRCYASILSVVPNHAEARAALDELCRENAGELPRQELSRLPDPLAATSPEWRAEEDAAHAEWKDAWVRETEHCRVRTDAGYEVLETACLVVEQVAARLALVLPFLADAAEGRADRAEVWIFRDAEEYAAVAQPRKSAPDGFLEESRLVTFDPSRQGGSRRQQLYPLLAASSAELLLRKTELPPWLFQGLVSSLGSSEVLKNRQLLLVPLPGRRLDRVAAALQADEPLQLASLVESGGDEHAAQALLEFLWQERDDRGSFPYRALLAAYAASFQPREPPDRRRSSSRERREYEEYEKLNALGPAERFAEFFVERTRVPGIRSLGDLEKAWRAAVLERQRLEALPLDALDAEIARAAELAGKDARGAGRILTAVRRRLPRSPRVLWHLGSLLAGWKQTDEALVALKDFLKYSEPAFATAESFPEEREEAEKLWRRLDPAEAQWSGVHENLLAAVDELVAGYAEAGMPRMAMLTAEKLLGIPPLELPGRRRLADLEEASGVTIRPWRALFNERDLGGWYSAKGNYWVEDGVLHGRVTAADRKEEGATADLVYRILFLDEEIRGDFSFEGEMLSIYDEDTGRHCSLFGLAFGVKGVEDFRAANFLPFATFDFGRFQGEWQTDRERLPLKKPGEWVRIRLDVAGDHVTASLDGVPLFEKGLAPGAVQGDLGVLTGDGHALFRNLRILPGWGE